MNSEAWLRTQYQNVIKEREELQLQCEQLINENYNLKKAVFELSNQLSLIQPNYYFLYSNLLKKFNFINLKNNNLQSIEDIQRNNQKNENRTLNFECELKGHSGAIYCVDISPDNRWIASGSFDKTIVIWKGNFPYKQVAILSGHTQLVSGLCWGHNPLSSTTTSNTSSTLSSSTTTTNSQDKKNDSNAPILFSTSFDKTVN